MKSEENILPQILEQCYLEEIRFAVRISQLIHPKLLEVKLEQLVQESDVPIVLNTSRR